MASRRTAAAAVGLVVLAGGSGGSWWAAHRPPPAAPDTVPVSTAPVVKTDLATTVELAGSLQYTAGRTLSAQGSGIVTALPGLGQVITRGHALFEVDGEPVLLAYGSRPAWRPFGPGMTKGRDVRQLEQNLVALGFADRRTLTVDTTFTAATTAAVKRWQKASGRPRTGMIELGDVVFAAGAVRVSSRRLEPGDPVQPGIAVLGVTSTTVNVVADVPADQTSLVRAGNRVSITLPSQKTTPGRVLSVSSVASAPADSGSGNGSGNNGSGNGGSDGPAVVQALIALTRPAAAGSLDQAPVTVTVVGRSVRNAVVVPITALVALADGGVAVYLRAGATRTLVPVTPGLYTDTQVELTSDTVRVGQQVEVPAQ